MIVLGFILAALSGISEAVMDILDHKFYGSVFSNLNKKFWNPEFSHANKWMNGDKRYGERFFGSSTFFVWTTDAWHLFKSIRTVTLWSGLIILMQYSVNDKIIIIAGAYILNRVMFESSYRFFKMK